MNIIYAVTVFCFFCFFSHLTGYIINPSYQSLMLLHYAGLALVCANRMAKKINSVITTNLSPTFFPKNSTSKNCCFVIFTARDNQLIFWPASKNYFRKSIAGKWTNVFIIYQQRKGRRHITNVWHSETRFFGFVIVKKKQKKAKIIKIHGAVNYTFFLMNLVPITVGVAFFFKKLAMSRGLRRYLKMMRNIWNNYRQRNE